MRIQLRQTEDGQIHLVTQGECHGELHFRDYSAFVTFVENWDGYLIRTRVAGASHKVCRSANS